MILRLATHAMATRFELVLAGEDAARLRAVGEAALLEIEQCEERLSLFRRGSLISHVNAHAHQRWVELDADTFELLEVCAEVHRDSGGAFDVTVGPLMRALGFHAVHGDTVADHAVEAATRAVGMDGLVLDRDRQALRFARPGMAIDLGAVGKGHALDLAAAVLREHGVRRALLHGGTSTVTAIGAPPRQPGWRVSVGHAPSATAVLRDATLSVSAPHGRVLARGGELVGHVLDPRRRAPARRHLLAAVLGRDARRTDAWSTALLVGSEATPPCPELATLLASGAVDGALTWTQRGELPGSGFVLPPGQSPRALVLGKTRSDEHHQP